MSDPRFDIGRINRKRHVVLGISEHWLGAVQDARVWRGGKGQGGDDPLPAIDTRRPEHGHQGYLSTGKNQGGNIEIILEEALELDYQRTIVGDLPGGKRPCKLGEQPINRWKDGAHDFQRSAQYWGTRLALINHVLPTFPAAKSSKPGI